MPTSILATNLYLPPIRSDAVSRLRLVERLDDEPRTELTLILAPAGFGNTTLVSDWADDVERSQTGLELNDDLHDWRFSKSG